MCLKSLLSLLSLSSLIWSLIVCMVWWAFGGSEVGFLSLLLLAVGSVCFVPWGVLSAVVSCARLMTGASFSSVFFSCCYCQNACWMRFLEWGVKRRALGGVDGAQFRWWNLGFLRRCQLRRRQT